MIGSARPRPANRPADTPAAAVVAILIAIALIAIGIIAGREFLIVRGAFHGHPWLRDLLEWLGRIRWHAWLLPVAIVAVLLGVVLLAVAAKPRNRSHIGTKGEPTLWLRPTDLARASTAAALRVGGIDHARTTARKRTVEIHVVTDRAVAEVMAAIVAEAGSALAELADPPRVRVSVEPATTASPRRAARPGVAPPGTAHPDPVTAETETPSQ